MAVKKGSVGTMIVFIYNYNDAELMNDCSNAFSRMAKRLGVVTGNGMASERRKLCWYLEDKRSLRYKFKTSEWNMSIGPWCKQHGFQYQPVVNSIVGESNCPDSDYVPTMDLIVDDKGYLPSSDDDDDDDHDHH